MVLFILSQQVYSAVRTLMRLVDPGRASIEPWMATTDWPDSIHPHSFAVSTARRRMDSVPSIEPMTKARVPLTMPETYRAVSGVAVRTRIGASGRYLATSRAVLPVSVHTMMSLASRSMEVLTADD